MSTSTDLSQDNLKDESFVVLEFFGEVGLYCLGITEDGHMSVRSRKLLSFSKENVNDIVELIRMMGKPVYFYDDDEKQWMGIRNGEYKVFDIGSRSGEWGIPSTVDEYTKKYLEVKLGVKR